MTEQPTHEQICEKCKAQEVSMCEGKCCWDCRACKGLVKWCWKDSSKYEQKVDEDDVEEDVEEE